MRFVIELTESFQWSYSPTWTSESLHSDSLDSLPRHARKNYVSQLSANNGIHSDGSTFRISFEEGKLKSLEQNPDSSHNGLKYGRIGCMLMTVCTRLQNDPTAVIYEAVFSGTIRTCRIQGPVQSPQVLGVELIKFCLMCKGVLLRQGIKLLCGSTRICYPRH